MDRLRWRPPWLWQARRAHSSSPLRTHVRLRLRALGCYKQLDVPSHPRVSSMATLTDLISRARLEVGDTATPFRGDYPGDGVTTTIVTDSKPLADGTIIVQQDATTLTLNADYTIDIED